jgi:predicted trehalose synthase
MWRIAAIVVSSLIITSCSGGIGSYEEGMNAQGELMAEMISVLKGVEDEASANKAADRIKEIGGKMAEIANRMKELPRPDAKEMQELAQKQREKMRAIQQDAMEQMVKIAQYPVLQDAWMNAMNNVH